MEEKLYKRNLDIEEKIALIEEIRGGMDIKIAALKYGLSRSSIYRILQKEQKFIDWKESSKNKRQRTVRKCPNDPINQAIVEFIRQSVASNITLTSDIVRKEALNIAATLGFSGFKASDGWLHRLKNRYDLSFKPREEGTSAKVGPLDSWKSRLAAMISGYRPEDVFSAEEAGLLYKCLPDKVRFYENQRFSSGEDSGERLSLMLAVNSTGTEKLPLVVVGKAYQPRCIKELKALPIHYRGDDNSWLSAELFEEWVLSLEKQFAKYNRRILLLVDSCRTLHKKDPNSLNFVNLQHFPSDVPCLIQPLTQGVIRALRYCYRAEFVKQNLKEFEEHKRPAKIDLLPTVTCLSTSWAELNATAIVSGFRKASFNNIPNTTDAAPRLTPTSGFNLDVNQITKDWSRFGDIFRVNFEFDTFVDFDNSVVTHGNLSAPPQPTVHNLNMSGQTVPTNYELCFPPGVDSESFYDQVICDGLQAIYNRLLQQNNPCQDLFTSYFTLRNHFNKK